MKDRKKRNIIIGSLCCLLIIMGIGYAILSQTLNISGIANMKGTWDIKITDISEASRTGKADPGTPTISTSGVSASFEANLWMPGDSITYNITVKNNGNIDAALKELVPSVENGVQQVKFSNNAVQGKVLRQSESYTFQVSVVFDENATEIPTDSKTNPPKYTISLTFVQYTGNSLYTPTNETTDNSCFVINTAGEITGYDYNCGKSITIPNEIDNITVKSVNFGLFNGWDALVGIKGSTNTTKIYFKDSKAKLKYDACLASSSNNPIKELNSSESGISVLTNTLSQNTLLMVDKANFTLDETNGFDVLEPENTTNIAGEYIAILEGKDIMSIYLVANDLSIKNKLLKWFENNPNETPEKIYVLTKEEASKKQFLTYPDVDIAIYSTLDNCDIRDESGVLLDYLDLSNAKNLKLSSDTFMNAKLGTLILSNPLDSNVENVFTSSKINKLIVTTDFVNTNNQKYQFNSSKINTAIITSGDDTKLVNKNTGIGYSIFEGSKLINLIITDGITEIGPVVFKEANIENLRFSGTLKVIGSNAFASNKLTNTGLGKLPSSLTSLATDAFSNNLDLTQITLTSPKDLPGWPNGGTVDGKTVTYER